MLKLLEEFKKDAAKLKRSATVEEFKLWLEAHKKRADMDENSSYVDEAIEFILHPNHEIELLSDLAEAVSEMDKESAKHLLKQIEKNRSRIFDDGIYHLPGKPLQDLVEEFISEVEDWVEGTEEETP